MENLVLKNDKEKLFLEELIISEDIYNYPDVKNDKEFRNLITYRNHERSWALSELNREVEDNLLLLTNKDARITYLKRLIQKIETIDYIQKKCIELLVDRNDDEYQYIIHFPGKPQIVFSVSKMLLVNSRKAGLAYLGIFKTFIKNHLNIETQTELSQFENFIDLKNWINESFIKFIYSMQRDVKSSRLSKKDFELYAKREDARTNYLYNKFEVLETIRCIYQSHIGRSGTGKTEGIADFLISDVNGKPIALCEAFNHELLKKKEINEHLTKIFNYNSQRLNLWYVLIYYEGNFKNFHKSYTDYINYVRNEISFEFALDTIKDVTNTFPGIKSSGIGVAKAEHFWNDDKTLTSTGFHFFIDISSNEIA